MQAASLPNIGQTCTKSLVTRPGVWSTGARRSFATRSLSARTQTLFESDVGYLRSIARPLAKAVQPEPQGIVQKFMAAWRIFFPERPNDSTPKEEGKNRLRMILVADRCGITPASLSHMRESIVKAVSDYVDIETEEEIEVNLSTDPELGTIYSVAVPVKRVKPSRVVSRDGQRAERPAIAKGWDPENPSSDASDQFPYGV